MFPTINYRRWVGNCHASLCYHQKPCHKRHQAQPWRLQCFSKYSRFAWCRLRATSTSPKTFPRGPFPLEKPELHSDLFWTFCLVQSLLGQLLCSTCTSLASSLVTHDAMKYQALQNHPPKPFQNTEATQDLQSSQPSEYYKHLQTQLALNSWVSLWDEWSTEEHHSHNWISKSPGVITMTKSMLQDF